MAAKGQTSRLESHFTSLAPDQVSASAQVALDAAASGKKWKTVEYLAGVLDDTPKDDAANPTHEGGAPAVVTFRTADPHRPECAYGSTQKPAPGTSLDDPDTTPLVGASDLVVPKRIDVMLTVPGGLPKEVTLVSDGTRKSIAKALAVAYRAVLEAGEYPVSLGDLTLVRLAPDPGPKKPTPHWVAEVVADSHAGGHDDEITPKPPPFPYKRLFIEDSPQDYFERLRTREYVTKSTRVKPPRPPRGRHIKIWPPSKGIPWKFDGKSFALVIGNNEYAEVGSFTDLFTEEARMAARVGAGPSPKEAWDNPGTRAKIALKAAELVPKNPQGLYALREGVYHVASEATSFKTSLAAAVCRLFGATAVLDPSSGWGDRALGAAASGPVTRYVGIDPNPALEDGYGRIVEFVKAAMPGTHVGFRQMGAEEYTAADLADDFPDGPPDLVFTSPPFFDFETYSADEKQSVAKHPTLESWVTGWLLPVMATFWKYLAPGGIFAIYIADAGGYNIVAPLVKQMSGLANKARPRGKFRGAIACRLANKRPVPLLVWQKGRSR
jgi:hypothetical protein